MKALHFGAGNIGRGFIGLILSQSGYELSFADVSEGIIDALKARTAYTVQESSDTSRIHTVKNVHAYHSVKDVDALIDHLCEVNLVTTAVGPSILPHIARSLFPMVQKRMLQHNQNPLTLIACENTIGGSKQLKDALYELLNEEEKVYCDRFFAFPNSAVDRIVPNQKNDDVLHVKVEPFFEWVIDSTQLNQELHLKNVVFTDNLNAFIERKLFTVNTGHASVAYKAYPLGYKTIGEAMKDAFVYQHVLNVLHETGALLCLKYKFSHEDHEAYIQKTLKRFMNPAIIDEVIRVGRSPLRKLSINDRFIKPFAECVEAGLPVDALKKAIYTVLDFAVIEDPEANELQELRLKMDDASLLLKVSGLTQDSKAYKALIK